MFRSALIQRQCSILCIRQAYELGRIEKLCFGIESENQCMRQTRLFIDPISQQQGHILALEEERKRQDKECGQLRALVQDLERKGIKKMVGDLQVPVAAVVVMVCNRTDYLERTIISILKYQIHVASRYPLFISKDGSDPLVKKCGDLDSRSVNKIMETA